MGINQKIKKNLKAEYFYLRGIRSRQEIKYASAEHEISELLCLNQKYFKVEID